MSNNITDYLKDLNSNKNISYRDVKASIKSIDEENYTITVYTSIPVVDRSNEYVDPKDIIMTNYMKNPVFVADHNYKVEYVIGKCIDFGIDNVGFWQTFKYYVDAPNDLGKIAKWAWFLAKEGVAAFSIGYIAHNKVLDRSSNVIHLKNVELVETSQVVIPSNPETVINNVANKYVSMVDNKELPNELIEYLNKSISNVEIKKVIPYKNYGYAEDNYKWDASRERAEASVDDLKQMAAWYDDSNPDVKESYKLLHHRASDKKCVKQALYSILAVLNGARGGVDIPKEDRKGVYNHIKKHADDLGITLGDLKSDNEYELYKSVSNLSDKLDEVTNKLELITDEVTKMKSDLNDNIDNLNNDFKNFKSNQLEINKRLSNNSSVSAEHKDNTSVDFDDTVDFLSILKEFVNESKFKKGE